ncbi:MAG TPA: PEP-CTERM sorting domain-containing protein [Sedimentisphaerales bacterium]|nr:PEP-CTERM sorting domain-containing protein [Sedimentisphaerales bacterium]
MKKVVLVCGAVLALFATAPPADAGLITLGFRCITNNNPVNAAIGVAQLRVDVIDSGPGEVTFTFRNIGPDPSVITEIYFDDGPLLAQVRIVGSPPGVDFVSGAKPENLPGGEALDPDFVATEWFSAEAVSPPPQRGVGPGEQVSIIFTLVSGRNWQDVVDGLQLHDGSLRLGLHVTSIGGGGSESFVHIPEPATLAILGLGGLLLRRRRIA